MISVIIPALNEEKYIESTLKSVKNSDYNDYEVIVVANACTDNTVDKSKKLADRIVVLKENGVSNARNKGAKVAKGEIVVFLDADTHLTKDTLSKISLLKGLGTTKVKPDVNRLIAKLAMWIKSVFWWRISSNGIIFCDKKIFDKVNGFDISLTKGEDGDFLKKAKKLGSYNLADSYVINSMRRFEKWGYFGAMFYWIREKTFPSKKEYPIIR